MNITETIRDRIDCVLGDYDSICKMSGLYVRKPLSEDVFAFLDEVSKKIMSDKRSRQYSDVFAFAFWIRKASLQKLCADHIAEGKFIRLGKGVVFHIAPSNVPVMFAYSLVIGLITGNANIVRISSKPFPQIAIICDAFRMALQGYLQFGEYISVVRYERDRSINDLFSSMADVRIIWGGDSTVNEIRMSPIPPRSFDITFADRYSLAVIDSDEFMQIPDKTAIARAFYNDSFLFDQNACTSPRIVVWHGSRISEAKDLFWNEVHAIVDKEYSMPDIKSVDKFATGCMLMTMVDNAVIIPRDDNLIIRIEVDKLSMELMDRLDNCGFFVECDCNDVMELKEICSDKRCQTVGIIGDKEWIKPLLNGGIKGIDQVVPVGHTMDFDMVWDGYDLITLLTRIISIKE